MWQRLRKIQRKRLGRGKSKGRDSDRGEEVDAEAEAKSLAGNKADVMQVSTAELEAQ